MRSEQPLRSHPHHRHYERVQPRAYIQNEIYESRRTESSSRKPPKPSNPASHLGPQTAPPSLTRASLEAGALPLHLLEKMGCCLMIAEVLTRLSLSRVSQRDQRRSRPFARRRGASLLIKQPSMQSRLEALSVHLEPPTRLGVRRREQAEKRRRPGNAEKLRANNHESLAASATCQANETLYDVSTTSVYLAFCHSQLPSQHSKLAQLSSPFHRPLFSIRSLTSLSIGTLSMAPSFSTHMAPACEAT
jgi:hypothetical protein